MNKQEFLASLNKYLYGLPKQDIEERLTFYGEMIDDRIEEGLSEKDAVSAIGTPEEIAEQIIADTPLTKIAKQRIKSTKKLKAWEIVLLALGSPIWLSLIIAAVAVILSLYVSLLAVIISLWAVFASLVACFISSVPACVIFAIGGNLASGVFILSAGIICASLAIFMFYGCKAATSGILILTKKIAIWIKNCFRGRENAQ